MFVPLRWLRETPRHLLVCERSHVRHERSRHEARVRDHAFNCRVSKKEGEWLPIAWTGGGNL